MNLESISANYREIQKRIVKAERGTADPSKVHLIAVSKGQSADAIQEVYQLGHRDFGENYAQEMLEKVFVLESRGCKGIRWHFIGHLQTNKVKSVVPFIHCLHTVDSEKLCEELAKRWVKSSRKKALQVFIEVNLDNENSKSGLNFLEVQKFANNISRFPEFDIQGLMGIPVRGQDIRFRFKKLRELELSCRPLTKGMLSMGMSDDFETAIQEGATHIRIGTAIFGNRVKKV